MKYFLFTSEKIIKLQYFIFRNELDGMHSLAARRFGNSTILVLYRVALTKISSKFERKLPVPKNVYRCTS